MAQPAGLGGRNGRWTALLSLFVASVIGMGTITSGDPWIAHLVGFLLTAETKTSVFATANIGVVVAMLVGAALYAILTYICHCDVPPIKKGESHE
ncbi:permease of a carbohydrate transport system [Escherichia coli]|nr:hypothetical protein [Escherichia coli]GDW54944.1 permease of a carbohydrate transport system [Escherichia coli]